SIDCDVWSLSNSVERQFSLYHPLDNLRSGKATTVEQYHDDLDDLLGLNSSKTNQALVLNLTEEDDVKKLVELAHFKRFPTEEYSSGMSQEEMLTRIVRFALYLIHPQSPTSNPLDCADISNLLRVIPTVPCKPRKDPQPQVIRQQARRYNLVMTKGKKMASLSSKRCLTLPMGMRSRNWSNLLTLTDFRLLWNVGGRSARRAGEETFTGLEIILKGTLELNAGDIKKLIQLAHFKRFRTKEGLSRMSEETMLRALKTVPQAQTNTGIPPEYCVDKWDEMMQERNKQSTGKP
ncbi:hypothetical protein MJO29_006613, partial [Puccinia striiformis f. sp. tritici]